MQRRSPQEKKRLSYLKDRRNFYGENQKSSRRNIPRSRRANHHALRRGEQLALGRLRAFGGAVDDSEVRFARRSTGQWRKSADAPLAEVVAYRLERRARLGIDTAPRSQERLRRVRSAVPPGRPERGRD
ncbi:hypothetical protein F4556_000107 [Kitasatospora gansuensis]|uniref:Uncharacterized protein n=1 Tax=Kitasatospora gansuensis TaxID=258050 RepID=A0A7W7S6U6_9ACTN|nr:hypothetical protein [Kitasatospora gansuensis]MBB4944572.1 hypothetical protein [Kitasatospora gansuensis]